MQVFNVLILLAFLAFISVILARVIGTEIKHRALTRRMDLYNAWVQRVMKEAKTDEEKIEATSHMMRIMREGPAGGYYGPWCDD